MKQRLLLKLRAFEEAEELLRPYLGDLTEARLALRRLINDTKAAIYDATSVLQRTR